MRTQQEQGRAGASRWRTVALVGSISLVVSFAASVAAGAVLGDDGSPNPNEPKRSGETVVARGSSAELGRWELTVASSDRGRCRGIRLLDTSRGGLPPDFYEGCGVGDGLDAASLNGNAETLVYGEAPAAARSVVVTAAGGLERSAATVSGPDDARFFVVAIAGGARDVEVRAQAADGVVLGSAPVPVPSR